MHIESERERPINDFHLLFEKAICVAFVHWVACHPIAAGVELSDSETVRTEDFASKFSELSRYKSLPKTSRRVALDDTALPLTSTGAGLSSGRNIRRLLVVNKPSFSFASEAGKSDQLSSSSLTLRAGLNKIDTKMQLKWPWKRLLDSLVRMRLNEKHFLSSYQSLIKVFGSSEAIQDSFDWVSERL